MEQTTIKNHTYSEEEIKRLSEEIATVPTNMPDDNDPTLLVPPTEDAAEIVEAIDADGNIVQIDTYELSEKSLEVSKTSMEIISGVDNADIVKLIEFLNPEFVEKNIAPIANNKVKLAALATEVLPPSILEEVDKLPSADTRRDVKAHLMRQVASLTSNNTDLTVDVFKEMQEGMAKVTGASKAELGQIRKESIDKTLEGLTKLLEKAMESGDVKAQKQLENTICAIKSGTTMEYLIRHMERLQEENRLKHVIKRGMRMEEKNLRKVYYRLESDKNFSFHRPNYMVNTLCGIYKEKYAHYEISEFAILLWDLVMEGTSLDSATAYFTSAILSNVYHYQTPYFDTMREEFDKGMEKFFEVLSQYYRPGITE